VHTYNPECGETAYSDWVRANEEKARAAREAANTLKEEVEEKVEEIE